MSKWYYIDIGYACFGIEINEKNIIIKSAPIAQWMIGKTLWNIAPWLEKKGAKVQEVTHKKTR